MAAKFTISDLPTQNERMAKAIMALIADRRSIVGKSHEKYATFILGDTFIQLGMAEIIIGDTKFKLGKPKKK